MLNQIELHPYFPQPEMRAADAELGVLTESWSPMGKRQAPFAEPVVKAAAEAHGVTPGQVVLRWQLQLGTLPDPAVPQRPRGSARTSTSTASSSPTTRWPRSPGWRRPDGRLFGGDPDTHEEF